MSHVFPRHSHISAPIAVSGEGCYLIDRMVSATSTGPAGRQYLVLATMMPTSKPQLWGSLITLPLRTQGFFK